MSKINTWDCVVVDTVERYKSICGVDNPLYFITIDCHNNKFEHCDPYASELTCFVPLERYLEAKDANEEFNTRFDRNGASNSSEFDSGILEYKDGYVYDQGI